MLECKGKELDTVLKKSKDLKLHFISLRNIWYLHLCKQKWNRLQAHQ